MNWFFIVSYLGLQLLLSYIISRRIHSETDYFLGGRSLPLSLVSLSLFATWFGAETCIGSSGAVYAEGLSGSRADPFGYSLCLLLMGLLLARPLWLGKYMTLADFYKERYGDLIEKITVWILIPSSLIWAAAQVRAFGQVISVTTELPVEWAIFAASVFVVGYTFLGGLLGDIITDVIQGSILALSLITLLFFCLHQIPDLSDVFQQMDSARLSFMAAEESLWERMDRWMVPILGSLVAQELISRTLSAKSASVARSSSFVACGIYLFLGSIPVLLGLIGPQFIPNLQDSEQFLPQLAKEMLPPVLFIVFSGALISAVLSTIDSILLAISALVSHNFLVPLLQLNTNRSKIICARSVVVVAGVLAFIMALYAEGVYDLVEVASSFGTAGILVITIMGIYSSWGKTGAPLAALITGVVVTPLGEYVFQWDAPFLISVTAALGSFVLFSLWSLKNSAEVESELSLTAD